MTFNLLILEFWGPCGLRAARLRASRLCCLGLLSLVTACSSNDAASGTTAVGCGNSAAGSNSTSGGSAAKGGASTGSPASTGSSSASGGSAGAPAPEPGEAPAPWQVSEACQAQVGELLESLSLAEKIGQMTLAERNVISTNQVRDYFIGAILSEGGSYPLNGSGSAWADMTDRFHQAALQTPHAIPLIYGSDGVHGHTWVPGAVIFPHNIGLGAAHDRELVSDAARVTARELRATGVDWTFSPVVAAPRDERWGRTYEGFSEDPELAGELGAAAVMGYQGGERLEGENNRAATAVLATAKHFAGDGATACGSAPSRLVPSALLDEGDVQLDEETFRRVAVAPYVQAIASGVGSIMVSYSSYRGVLMHRNRELLTGLLKGELGFQGFVVSDYRAIEALAASRHEQVVLAVNAGIDMFMERDGWYSVVAELKAAVASGEVLQSRIDDAARRILSVKCEMGLLRPDYTGLVDRAAIAEIGSEEHRAVARRAVQKSLTLLENDGILPLAKRGRIHVAGSAADSVARQCGGWTMTWQGAGAEGTSVLEGLREVVEDRAEVTYSPDGLGAAGADVAIAVIGETPYAEWFGDSSDLSLSAEDVATLRNLNDAGVPVVAVLISGRPMIITPQLPLARAWVAAWLPGSEGAGISDVLFGDVQPTAKLGHSWPARMDQIPINSGDADYDTDPPLYPLGYGLSYP